MADDELNKSFARLQQTDMDDIDDIIGGKARWIEKVKQKLNVELEGNLQFGAFNSSAITKKTLATWTAEARDIMTRQGEQIENMQEIIELMKTEALADKAAVILLQSDLLKSKNAEIESMRTAVQETVHSSVQEGIQSYSAAVASNTASTAPVFTPESLKKVVRTVMVEEDRNKNLLVFGLADEENVEQAVSELFLELGEKPRVQAVNRIGGKCSTPARPVIVTLASATSVNEILSKTSRLKKTERYKSVYVCPDRSPKEREARKQLVVDLKKAMADQPNLYHYIRAGTIHSRDKDKADAEDA
jgi:hypothetical protein